MDIYVSTNEPRESLISKVADLLREERARATDIESAVDKAGIDRDEITATFGSMHGLILEMVSDLSGALIQPLEEHATDRPMREVLIEFGDRLADAYCASHLIALYRIALTEATRHTGIGREFFDRGPGKLTMCLAQYLEHSARGSNQLRIKNPNLAADNFLSLLRDNLELSVRMTATRTSSAKADNDAVVEAVELFCHGIIPEGQ